MRAHETRNGVVRSGGNTSGSDGGGRANRSGGRSATEGGAGSGGESNSSWGLHHQAVQHKNSNNNSHHIHQDDSGHSSGGEGVNGAITSGSERINHVGNGSLVGSLTKGHHQHREHHHETLSSEYSMQFANDGKHSLLQFALKYFRMTKEQNMVAADGTLQTNKDKKKKKSSKDSGADWTWKEQVNKVTLEY